MFLCGNFTFFCITVVVYLFTAFFYQWCVSLLKVIEPTVNKEWFRVRDTSLAPLCELWPFNGPWFDCRCVSVNVSLWLAAVRCFISVRHFNLYRNSKHWQTFTSKSNTVFCCRCCYSVGVTLGSRLFLKFRSFLFFSFCSFKEQRMSHLVKILETNFVYMGCTNQMPSFNRLIWLNVAWKKTKWNDTLFSEFLNWNFCFEEPCRKCCCSLRLTSLWTPLRLYSWWRHRKKTKPARYFTKTLHGLWRPCFFIYHQKSNRRKQESQLNKLRARVWLTN